MTSVGISWILGPPHSWWKSLRDGTHSIFLTSPWHKHNHYPCFKAEERQAHGYKRQCSKSPKNWQKCWDSNPDLILVTITLFHFRHLAWHSSPVFFLLSSSPWRENTTSPYQKYHLFSTLGDSFVRKLDFYLWKDGYVLILRNNKYVILITNIIITNMFFYLTEEL